jgi:hypothetical protein
MGLFGRKEPEDYPPGLTVEDLADLATPQQLLAEAEAAEKRGENELATGIRRLLGD